MKEGSDKSRWLPAMAITAGALLCFAVALLFSVHSVTDLDLQNRLEFNFVLPVALLTMLLAILASAASLVVRRRRSRRKETLAVSMSLFLGIAALVFLVPAYYNPGRPAEGTCKHSLYEIHISKHVFELERNGTNGQVVTWEDLKPHSDHDNLPKCPEGGVLTINPLGTRPECSIHGKY